jgi:uncharacterized membrane protein
MAMTEAPSPAPAGNLELGPLISKAWTFVTGNLVLILVSYLILAVIGGIPCVGFVLMGPLMIGFVRIIQRRLKGETPEIGDIFKGFQEFGRGFVTGLLMLLCCLAVAIPLYVLAIILGHIPVLGFVLAPLVMIVGAFCALAVSVFSFVWPMVASSTVSPTEAVSKSFKFLLANAGPMLTLTLVATAIGMAGVIACGIGMIFTVPLGIVMMVMAYEEYYLPKSQPAA